MTVFLFAFAPLTAAAALVLLGPRFGPGFEHAAHDRARGQLRTPLLVVAGLFVPLYGLQLLLRMIDLAYSPLGLFGEALLHHYLVWFLMQSLVSFVAVRRIGDLQPAEQFQVHVVCAGLLVFLLTLADIIGADSLWTAHELFLRPAATAMLLMLVPTALTVADTASGGGWAVLALLIQPMGAAAVSALAEWNRPGGAFAALALLAVGTGAVLWFLLRDTAGRHVST